MLRRWEKSFLIWHRVFQRWASLALMGVLGGGRHDERFDAKQIVVSPVGDGVRILTVKLAAIRRFRHEANRIVRSTQLL